MNSPPRKSRHHRCTCRSHTGHYLCSHWDTSGCCNPHQRSVRSTHISRLHTGPCHCSCLDRSVRCSLLRCSPHSTRKGHPRIGHCHCSCLDMSAHCSLLRCSPHGRRTGHLRICHCRCTHLGRRIQNSRGLPILRYRGSCRCRVGRYHGHYSFCPRLDKEICQHRESETK